MRWRTAVAAPILLVGLLVYVLIAGTVGALALPDHWAARLVYYAVAGIAWIVPAIWLMGWARRDDQAGVKRRP